MKKTCKVLAVILAVLMMVSMTTACRKKIDNEWEDLDPSNGFDKIEQEDSQTGGKENETTPGTNEEDGKKPSGEEGTTPDQKDPEKNPDKNPSNNGGEVDPEVGDENEQQKVETNYNSEVKYEVEANPLLSKSKPINHGVLPSYDLDRTGFVKNEVKLADLRGKTFQLITAESQGNFYYTNDKGEQIDEWKWFELLKGELGLQVKYVESHWHSSIKQALTYMNAGKALDVIPTAAGGFPQFLNISQPLDPYVNIQNLGNSPGVDQMTLEETKYGGGYRCISPIGSVNLLLYNQSLVEELGLKDPHTMFQKDEWDWNAFRAFLTSVPTTTTDGKKLYSYRQGLGDWYMNWPMTNGVQSIALDHDNKEKNLINNWMDERVIESLTFFADTMKSVQDAISKDDGETLATRESYHRLFSDGTLVMSTRVWLMDDCDKYPYAAARKYNWVPFPKSPNENGRYVAYNIGYTMMIPRVVKNKNNIPYAVKFMELWANRCTEAIMDYMAEKVHYNFDYDARKEYFEFCIKNTYFGCEMSNWRLVSGAAKEAFRNTTDGYIYAGFNSNINMATKHKEIANYVDQAIKDTIEYGS